MRMLQYSRCAHASRAQTLDKISAGLYLYAGNKKPRGMMRHVMALNAKGGCGKGTLLVWRDCRQWKPIGAWLDSKRSQPA
jgi:hypothetical protein